MTSLALNAALQGYLNLSTTQLLVRAPVSCQPDLKRDDIAAAMACAFEAGWQVREQMEKEMVQ